jgi:hypothetical protein
LAALYADENFPHGTVVALRALGHDVLTAFEAGRANQAIADEAVLADAQRLGRAVLTLNRWEFVRLHSQHREHAGIVVCTVDVDFERQAARIDAELRGRGALRGVLVRVNRPG